MTANSQTAPLLSDRQMQEFIRNGYVTLQTSLPDEFHASICRQTDALLDAEPKSRQQPAAADPGAVEDARGPGGAWRPDQHSRTGLPAGRSPLLPRQPAGQRGAAHPPGWRQPGAITAPARCCCSTIPRTPPSAWGRPGCCRQPVLPGPSRGRGRAVADRRRGYGHRHPLRTVARRYRQPRAAPALHDEVPAPPDAGTAGAGLGRGRSRLGYRVLALARHVALASWRSGRRGRSRGQRGLGGR